jgi:hypothetical protein
MDIHHISTGRGNCAFVIGPDATTLMIDAGALYPKAEVRKYVVEAFPEATRSPADWISRYVRQQLRGIREPSVDAFVATHFHGDHIGELDWRLPKTSSGKYQLTGITELASLLAIHKVVDRAYPDYNYPAPLTEGYQRNYVSFVQEYRRRGGAVERLAVGSAKQIGLARHPSRYDFEVRNIAANGEVWTGEGDATRHTFPPLAQLALDNYPSENMSSIALRIRYGRFRYFFPADLTGDTVYGKHPWRDIETAAANAAGPVDVALASHHGYLDATGPGFVAALRPRVFIIPVWDSAHPAMPGLHNMLSQHLYPGPRDIFSTAMKAENTVAARRLAELKCQSGHIVIRVAKGGDSYRVFVTRNTDESDAVIGVWGPYASHTLADGQG